MRQYVGGIAWAASTQQRDEKVAVRMLAHARICERRYNAQLRTQHARPTSLFVTASSRDRLAIGCAREVVPTADRPKPYGLAYSRRCDHHCG